MAALGAVGRRSGFGNIESVAYVGYRNSISIYSERLRQLSLIWKQSCLSQRRCRSRMAGSKCDNANARAVVREGRVVLESADIL